MGCSASTLRHADASAPTENAVNAVATKGLTLKGVLGLRRHLQQLCTSGHFKQPWDRDGVQEQGVDTFEQLTTKQVVYTWVRSVTGARCLADLQLHPAPDGPAPATGFTGSDVGKPTYFISHAWNGKESSCCVWSIAFSPDGKTLAARTWDNLITIWDLATERCSVSLQG